MKKLNVKAVVIDLRHVSEEPLASYEHIQIQASLAMTSPRTGSAAGKVSSGAGCDQRPVL